MRKIIILFVALMSVNTVFSQQLLKKNNLALPSKEELNKKTETPEERAKQQADRMEKLLALTPEQKAKVQAAALKKFNANKTTVDQHKNDADKKTMNQEIKKTKQTYLDDVNGILTPEQKAKWQTHRDKMKAESNSKKVTLKNAEETLGVDEDDLLSF